MTTEMWALTAIATPACAAVIRDLIALRRYRERWINIGHLIAAATAELRVIDRDAGGAAIDITMYHHDLPPTAPGN